MPTDNETPSHPPISVESVAWEAWQDVPRFAVRYRHLTSAVLGDAYHVGVAVEELAPGMLRCGVCAGGTVAVRLRQVPLTRFQHGLYLHDRIAFPVSLPAGQRLQLDNRI